MRTIHIERLRTLYAVMAGIPDAAIRLDYWRDNKADRSNPDDKELIALARTSPDQHNCGTTACALGWACAYPEFKKQGLRFKGRNWSEQPTFRAAIGMAAGAKFFGLTNDESEALFNVGRDNDVTDKYEFLQRLRDLLIEKEIITVGRSHELALEEQKARWAVPA